MSYHQRSMILTYSRAAGFEIQPSISSLIHAPPQVTHHSPTLTHLNYLSWVRLQLTAALIIHDVPSYREPSRLYEFQCNVVYSRRVATPLTLFSRGTSRSLHKVLQTLNKGSTKRQVKAKGRLRRTGSWEVERLRYVQEMVEQWGQI